MVTHTLKGNVISLLTLYVLQMIEMPFLMAKQIVNHSTTDSYDHATLCPSVRRTIMMMMMMMMMGSKMSV